MARKGIHIQPTKDAAAVPKGQLAHLNDLDDVTIASGEPDPRGWEVVRPDGRKVGTVDDLIVDTTDMAVRYIEVKVEGRVLGTDDPAWVLVPLEATRLDDAHDVAQVYRLPRTGIGAAPRYARGNPTPEQERAIRKFYEPAVG
jgi:photosynthetic reaction center H subunit